MLCQLKLSLTMGYVNYYKNNKRVNFLKKGKDHQLSSVLGQGED